MILGLKMDEYKCVIIINIITYHLKKKMYLGSNAFSPVKFFPLKTHYLLKTRSHLNVKICINTIPVVVFEVFDL